MNIKQKNNSEACRDRRAPKPIYSGIKRIFDVVFSFILLVFLFLPLILIALAVKLDSAGPVFYKQERLGLFGEPFVMLKFRTMIPDAGRSRMGKKGGSEKNEGRCVSPALSFGRASSALEYSCGGYELCRAPSRATDVLQRVRKNRERI